MAAHPYAPGAVGEGQCATGDLRDHALHPQLRQRGQEDTHRSHGRVGGKIMIRCRHRHATLAATGKGTDRDRRRRVERDASHIWCGIGSLIDLVHVREDHLGWGDFFVADLWRLSWESRRGC